MIAHPMHYWDIHNTPEYSAWVEATKEKIKAINSRIGIPKKDNGSRKVVVHPQ